MLSKALRSLFACALLAGSISALQAQEPVIHQKPIHMRHLNGLVIDRTGISLPYAEVVLLDAKDSHPLASTFADGNGKFAFEDRKRGQHLEIRATLKGFRPVQYEIAITRFGATRIRILLPAAA